MTTTSRVSWLTRRSSPHRSSPSTRGSLSIIVSKRDVLIFLAILVVTTPGALMEEATFRSIRCSAFRIQAPCRAHGFRPGLPAHLVGTRITSTAVSSVPSLRGVRRDPYFKKHLARSRRSFDEGGLLCDILPWLPWGCGCSSAGVHRQRVHLAAAPASVAQRPRDRSKLDNA